MIEQNFIYHFGETHVDGDDSMADILGGKGAALAQMCHMGLPVPPGFTVSTAVCRSFLESNADSLSAAICTKIKAALDKLGTLSGLHFGDEHAPLLISVRSGAPVSMPGMMDTILNLGLTSKSINGLIARSGDEAFAWDSYRRFIQGYASIVMDVPSDIFETIIDDVKLERAYIHDADIQAEDWKYICTQFKQAIIEEAGIAFPDNAEDQLWGAIIAIFKSWHNPRAKTYRSLHHIDENIGTAVTLQIMVFGNLGENSASGVAFTRNPSTGDKEIYGEYLPNAQGEDIVAGIRTPYPICAAQSHDGIDALETRMPVVFDELKERAQELEQYFKDMQDIEFTIEQGKLWLLQSRSGKRSTKAGLKIAVDLVHEGIIDEKQAVMQVDIYALDRLLHPIVDPSAAYTILARGLPASPGAVSGEIVFSSGAAEIAAARGKQVILVRMETSPEDIHGMYAANGILTSRGGMTSHAAVVARGLGKPCVSGAGMMRIDYDRAQAYVGDEVLHEGDLITIDGASGNVIKGMVKTIEPEFSDAFSTVMAWADKYQAIKIRANADTAEEARRARKFGAQGIGLCRTETMFFAPARIDIVRQMLLAEDKTMHNQAMETLESLQCADFKELFDAMGTMPVGIRLLDSGLHDFMPQLGDDLRKLAKDLNMDEDALRARISGFYAGNPLFGHRACRMGISHPEIYQMQMRAIFAAMQDCSEKPHIEIIVPLICDKGEMHIIRDMIKQQAEAWQAKKASVPPLQIGCMIETPRAALTAQELVPVSDFFTFGSNDLTQSCLGLSRDDAVSFLKSYQTHDIFPADPFVQIDIKGVGALMRIAIDAARAQKQDIEFGLCGDHGGDPYSIAYCIELGMDYVSCTPHRVAVARLSAAQAALKS